MFVATSDLVLADDTPIGPIEIWTFFVRIGTFSDLFPFDIEIPQ